MIREHYAAVRAMLPAGLTNYYGTAPKTPTFPYVVLWGDPGDEGGDSLGDVVDELTLRIRATYTGQSFDAVAITADRVRAVLNRQAPTVPGWSPGELRQSSLMGIQPDNDVTIPGTADHPFYAVDEFVLVSSRN